MTFADVPSELTGRALTEWLEERGVALVDYFAWLRTQDPEAGKRPPSRRRLLTQEQAARLDAEIEREGSSFELRGGRGRADGEPQR